MLFLHSNSSWLWIAYYEPGKVCTYISGWVVGFINACKNPSKPKNGTLRASTKLFQLPKWLISVNEKKLQTTFFFSALLFSCPYLQTQWLLFIYLCIPLRNHWTGNTCAQKCCCVQCFFFFCLVAYFLPVYFLFAYLFVFGSTRFHLFHRQQKNHSSKMSTN